MTAIYVESSALMTWLLGEPKAREVISALNRAQIIVTSVLSLVEVERALNRAEHQRVLPACLLYWFWDPGIESDSKLLHFA
jgi:uncharacterized protein with PIN domain